MIEITTTHAQVILNLVLSQDKRTEGMMPGWDIELALQKLIFFTAPGEFPSVFEIVSRELDNEFANSDSAMRQRMIQFMLGVAESLLSPVDLDHNLSRHEFHGSNALSGGPVAYFRKTATDLVKNWFDQDRESFLTVTARIKAEDLAANKGDNLFAGWARKWETENGRDPYTSVDDYLSCFGALYQRDMYYPALYFAREDGKTKTQFFNDYGLQAARCRRMGSLGGTTNPVIAVAGEDDMSGIGCIWGEEATKFICQFPNKWHEVRKVIAKEQVAGGYPDDWGATRFTEWVVV
ncbi:MAG: hypothetical protein N3B12_09235, partial [Armatimonadetes bacterium]|nr:hypothetical protein [Armatimonadota bacterium]